MLNSLQNASFNQSAVKFGSSAAAAVKSDKKFAADGNFTKEEKAVSAGAAGLTAIGIAYAILKKKKPAITPNTTCTALVVVKSKMQLACETLGLKVEATADEVKKAFKKLVKEHHPDHNGGVANPGAIEKLKAARDFILTSFKKK